jgi:hypothetical protein
VGKAVHVFSALLDNMGGKGHEGEEIDLDPSVLAMEPPPLPQTGGVWMEGWLRKRAPQGQHLPGRALQRRLCVLRTDALSYYEGKEGKAKSGGASTEEAGNKGRISLLAMQRVKLARTPDGPQIEISIGTRVFYFVAPDDATAHSWRLAIEAARVSKAPAQAKRLTARLSRLPTADLVAKVVNASQIDSRQRLNSCDGYGRHTVSGRHSVEAANAPGRPSMWAAGGAPAGAPMPLTPSRTGSQKSFARPNLKRASSGRIELYSGQMSKQDATIFSSTCAPRRAHRSPSPLVPSHSAAPPHLLRHPISCATPQTSHASGFSLRWPSSTTATRAATICSRSSPSPSCSRPTLPSKMALPSSTSSCMCARSTAYTSCTPRHTRTWHASSVHSHRPRNSPRPRPEAPQKS